MKNVKLGQVYKVVDGSFTGSVGVLSSGFFNGLYFVEKSNGDRVMVTASQIERVESQIVKPDIYAHLNDYQFALQHLLNSLSIFIRVDGKEINIEHYMPLSISQIVTVEKLYNIENTLTKGNTSYFINLKSSEINKIKDSDLSLAEISY